MGISQPYLSKLYKALISTAYYGLFRIGEITSGDRPIQVDDVFLTDNKNKIQIVLRSSKTHTTADHPQIVKITSHMSNPKDKHFFREAAFCPFLLLQDYMRIRKKRLPWSKRGPLFVFSDNTPVRPGNFSQVLKAAIKKCGLDNNNYSSHSLRSGRDSDRLKSRMSGKYQTHRPLEVKCGL